MKKLSPAQRLQIIQLYYENQRSARIVFRKLRQTYGQHNRSTESTIRSTVIQFSLLDNTRPNRPHPECSEENIVAVAGIVAVMNRFGAVLNSLACRMQRLGVFCGKILA
ncbi:Winged helix-turn-helix DNA-binding domain,Protein of unknown function DUF4817 [Cinara cedri]|uniref:DUF4817 domain-containing protein n=1 Tax=Cinara cedri TaxID=506608 RepID=A0A5E4M5Z6_9HEMI|nr:Winged helix-turn-helix DNA-binding domain,Protein of unknown function DUF4817 [Cinara cedri]